MARIANEKLDSIKSEVEHLHPLLNSLLGKLPRVRHVMYCHGPSEKGADFVVSRTHEDFGTVEYIGVIAKVGRILQNFKGIERQIDECSLPRLVEGGKKKIRLTEIWVIATKHITQGAKEKIHEKYRNRKIEFITGPMLEQLVDRYTPLAWSRLPIVVGEYLQDLRVRTEEQDKSVSLLQMSDEAFYIRQDLYHIPDIEYRYKPKHYRQPRRVDVDHITDSYRCILIEGGVGSGKSKLLRRLTTEASLPEVFRKTKVLPLLTTYTEVMKQHSGKVRNLIESRVSREVRTACPDSEYLVLIDAFDELPMDVDSQPEELNSMFMQASKEHGIRVVVTSRYLKGVDQGGVLRPNVARCELPPLSLRRTFDFIAKLCTKINIRDRILEDLKKSALFRNMPKSPMSAILLARLLNENQQDIPSNMTELYSKYSELMLGRWDEKKGLQSQKEYQALDNILMRLARQMIDSGRLFMPMTEVKDVFTEYLNQRNLEIEVASLIEKMVNRCEIVFVASDSGMLGFKHRSFTEFLYAKSFIADKQLVVDSRVFSVYWASTFFFYLGLRKDCPNDLQTIFQIPTRSEVEDWMKIINVSDYLLAAYTTPYRVIEEGVLNVAVTAAELYRKIVTQGSELSFGNLSKMRLLYLLQLFIRQGYSYSFFTRAIEDAALRIHYSSLDDETKAYALFFLNVAYIDIGGKDNEETFDFMLKRVGSSLPIDLQLAIRHEGKKIKERTKLMRKQDRYVRRILAGSSDRKVFFRNLYDRPINELVQQSLRAQKRVRERESKEKMVKNRERQEKVRPRRNK
ncbi:MAG: hypothetical protein OXN89_10290 [Bryobacterales bacterium]|nr:hypothetical protein [Bryobacterales bacterium]